MEREERRRRRRNKVIKSDTTGECSNVGKSLNSHRKTQGDITFAFIIHHTVHDGAATKEDLITALLIMRTGPLLMTATALMVMAGLLGMA